MTTEYIMITWWHFRGACFFVGAACMGIGMLIGELKHNREGLENKARKFMECLE